MYNYLTDIYDRSRDGSGLGDSQKDEGTACRVHGRVRVNKVKGDSVIITAGKGAGIDGLFAHVDGASNGMRTL